MIASMTGFARRETSGPWGTLVCELRSVNHRFLEASFRLPDELRGAEGGALVAAVRAGLPEVRARARTRLNGRVAELTASIDQERLEQELALLLQRLDVDEEL